MMEGIKGMNMHLKLGLIVAALAAVVAISLACGADEPSPVPAPQPTAAPAPQPTAAPAATPTPVRAAPAPQVKTGPKYGGTVRFAYHLEFDTMDPAYQTTTAMRRVMFTIYSSLVQMMPDSSIAPELAKSWDFSADGKAITFHLVEGVKFHDGTAADAQAVKWNYDRYLDKAAGTKRGKDLSPPLERVEVVDNTTVRFHLSNAARPFMQLLSSRPGMVASPTAVQKTNSYADRNGEFASNPVGSGMFKFKEWRPGQRIIMERNDNYFEKGLPYLDEIRFLLIPDNRVIFAMLRTGELEVQETLVPGDFELAKNNPIITVIRQDGARGRVIMFKMATPPWDNLALRQAFSYAMDRETIVDVVYNGLAEAAYSPIYSSFGVWHDPSFQMYKYDPQKAREKLAEAGFPNGFSYTQPCRAATFEQEFCEVAQVMLADIGINMAIQPWDNSTAFSDWVAGKYDQGFWGGYRARIDPDVMLRSFFHSNGSRNTPQRSNYRNPEFDKLLDEAVGIYDVAKAKAIYSKALEILMGDAAMVGQVAETQLYGINSDVRNFGPRPDAETRLRDLWLDR